MQVRKGFTDSVTDVGLNSYRSPTNSKSICTVWKITNALFLWGSAFVDSINTVGLHPSPQLHVLIHPLSSVCTLLPFGDKSGTLQSENRQLIKEDYGAIN